MLWKNGLYFDAEKGGAGNGGGNSTTTETDPTKTVTQPDGERKFTQAELDQIVKERLERERKKTQLDAEETRKKADAEAAAKNGEWQKLAEEREQAVKALQGQVREAQIREAALKAGVADLDYAVFLVTRAGDGADPEAVLKEYAAKNPAVRTELPKNATNPANQPATFTRSQLRDPLFFQANKAAILQAVREGRIRDE